MEYWKLAGETLLPSSYARCLVWQSFKSIQFDIKSCHSLQPVYNFYLKCTPIYNSTLLPYVLHMVSVPNILSIKNNWFLWNRLISVMINFLFFLSFNEIISGCLRSTIQSTIMTQERLIAFVDSLVKNFHWTW